jgi:predicted dehydrogenase
MRVGLIGTGAIANMHARAYRNIGFELLACANKTASRGRDFAAKWGAEFVDSTKALCHFPALDYVDVCSFPDSHLEPVTFCTEIKRPIMLQKPIATNLAEAREMVSLARAAGVTLGVMSQHRFDDSTLFLKRAIAAGRLGRILQAEGSWQTEGGGALINQAIHQVDILLHLIGPVAEVSGLWQLGARHKIESEDVVNAQFIYASGATGVIQAATAFWPGYTERIEIHGTKGSAIISGDRLTSWDVLDDEMANASDAAPLAHAVASGSSDPMAISVTTFERQFNDFAEAIRRGREPLSNGEEGYRALEFVLAVYRSCRERRSVEIGPVAGS